MTIEIDHETGRVSNASLTESVGMALLKLGAKLSKPMEFRGYSLGANVVGKVLPSSNSVRLNFADGRKFEFPYADAYWGVMLAGQPYYCPEFEPYMPLIADIDYVFIDCGANYGYMSVVSTSKTVGNKRTVAIEAHPVSAELSRRNAELNGNRFEVLHNAVFHTSGNTVRIGGGKHEARTILGDHDGADVETLALGDLVERLKLKKNQPVILKLDVEGVEIDAMKGAGALLDHPTMVVYEEHGNDPTHEVSAYLRDEMGMRLWRGGKEGNNLREITSDAEIAAMKTNTSDGYDMFATRDDLWIERLEQIAQTQVTPAGAAL
ncbi:FkbM family methyltransferase [Ahrensia sp. R2A130]|uniref:FkbM family methyltransferase n=1 Tax=Ahrensia sp. R2A130 TaxID=744979 RepID=UPI0001E09407|nr:FkbM family methyltransferase [Ahrensia sp. R2A130]EFL89990.1 methyltransferase FkbM [Ahrensia sp. R2A130]